MNDVTEKTAKVLEESKPVRFRYLTEECGPHCGAIATIGHHHITVGHCPCEICHQGKTFIAANLQKPAS